MFFFFIFMDMIIPFLLNLAVNKMSIIILFVLPKKYMVVPVPFPIPVHNNDNFKLSIDPSWWTHRAISRSSQCSTTGVTKAVVCVILCVG